MERQKTFISAREMERDSWQFAVDLYRSQQHFDWIIGVTRGGVQISIYLQEAFRLLTGRSIHYTTVQAQSYSGIGKAAGVRVWAVEGLLERVESGQALLVIDDVFDRGRTLEAVKTTLVSLLAPVGITISLGALYYKPENNQTAIIPDFFFRTFQADEWLVFPHELCGLSQEELWYKGFPLPKEIKIHHE